MNGETKVKTTSEAAAGRAVPAAVVSVNLCEECRKRGETWRREPPDEQCLWWWWNEDGWPIPVQIMYGGTDNRYFASTGQYGWNRAQYVEDMGGWWMRCVEPPLPQSV